MDQVEIKIDDTAVRTAFKNLAELAQDPAPIMGRVGRDLQTRVQLGFNASGSPNGKPWAPLKSRSGQPLRDTGRLRNSITYQVRSLGANHVELQIGTNVQYAPVHQFGAVIKPKNAKFLRFTVQGGAVVFTKGPVVVPARPFLPIDQLPQDWSAAIVNIISSELAKAASDAA